MANTATGTTGRTGSKVNEQMTTVAFLAKR
jgi:hypothetical protein